MGDQRDQETPPAWETRLRRCLAGQAATAPLPGDDLASRVVARARRQRRRRHLAGLATVVGATVLATGWLVPIWPGGDDGRTVLRGSGDRPAATEPTGAAATGDPAPPGGDDGGGVDRGGPLGPEKPARLPARDRQLAAELATGVVGQNASGDRMIATSDGRTLPVGVADPVISAHHVTDGWAVVTGDADRQRLWWVTPDAEPVNLLSGVDTIVVRAGRVAWLRESLLVTAELADGQLRDRSRTLVSAEPVALVDLLGRAVLLARPDATGAAGWDTWDPALGDYLPAWTRQVVRIYGLGTDAGVLGLLPERADAAGSCLVRLELARDLTVSDDRCLPFELVPDAPAALSPGGRWLVTVTAGQPVMVDLLKLFDGQVSRAVTVLSDVSPPADDPVWVGPDRLVVPIPAGLVQIRPAESPAGLSATVQEFPLTGPPPVLVRAD